MLFRQVQLKNQEQGEEIRSVNSLLPDSNLKRESQFVNKVSWIPFFLLLVVLSGGRLPADASM
jgi:hypothetical protein